MELRAQAMAAFTLADPAQKVAAVQALCADASALACDTTVDLKALSGPGRPARPLMIHPRAVPKRSPHTVAGHAALMHSIAHIEFNAINLALDAAWRFADLPEAYYRDWIQVAGEEALHFSMLQHHLQSLGFAYGDFDAHDGLWTMCVATEDDVLARMRTVLDKMMELESFNEVVEILRGVIRTQEGIRSDTLRRQKQRAREALERP